MRVLILAAGLASLFAGAAQAQGLAATFFKRLDTDADGWVSKAEWAASGRPAERFALVDTSKDGKISPDEMAAAIRKYMRFRGGADRPS